MKDYGNLRAVMTWTPQEFDPGALQTGNDNDGDPVLRPPTYKLEPTFHDPRMLGRFRFRGNADMQW
jgi:hypothetical protein